MDRHRDRNRADDGRRPEPEPTADARVPRVRWRRAVLLSLPVLYVAVTAARTAEASPRAWLAIATGLAVALLGATPRAGDLPADRRAHRARAWTTVALSLAVSSLALTERFAPVAAAREIALLGATLSALRAIGAIDPDAGLAARASEAIAARGVAPRTILLAASAVTAVAWGAAILEDSLAWSAGGASPAGGSMFASAGGAASLFAVGAAALLVAGVRRLELGAPPRALAAAAAVGAGLLVAIALAITTTVRADGAVALGAAASLPIVIRVSRAKDAAVVAAWGRRALTLLLYGGPVAALAALAAEGGLPGAGLVTLAIALATMGIGAAAGKLEEPLLPVNGALLDALAEATRAAHDRESRAAIAKALGRLREAAGHGAPSPELWMLHPTRIFTVDAAGYLQERDGEVPPLLLDLAHSEPHRTVRVEVLRALEVRRADLRPLLRWLEDRGALFATLVAEGDEPDGVVLVPAGTRSDPLVIDEVSAANTFAAAFVAVCQARSARERHLGRERALREQIDALDDELARVRHASALDASRHVLASTRLARPATVGIYSAASRMAYDALERRVQRDAPVVVVARAGIDPVPFVARAHLAGPRKEGPLVVVDGTSSREHDLERWRDERSSPLALADRGLLLLVDGAALPREVQVLVARSLAERRAPWERAMPLDVAPALTATRTPAVLAEEGLLAPELFARFEDAEPIALPGLHERSEDLFSIVADRLAREGLRVRGRPVGIDSAAFARLVEHPFEGEDAELASIVSRLVARAEGDVVRAADVEAIGIAATRDDSDDDAASGSEADAGSRTRGPRAISSASAPARRRS